MKMSLKHLLRDWPRWESWKETWWWLCAWVVGGFMPVWIGALALQLGEASWSWLDISSRGEFALYSASLVAPTLYVAFRDHKAPFPVKRLLGVLSLAIVVFAAVLFTMVLAKETPPTRSKGVASVTLGLFLVAFLIALLTVAFEHYLASQNPREVEDRQRARLKEEFDQLRE